MTIIVDNRKEKVNILDSCSNSSKRDKPRTWVRPLRRTRRLVKNICTQAKEAEVFEKRLSALLTIEWAGQKWWHFLECEGCTSLAGLRLGARRERIKNISARTHGSAQRDDDSCTPRRSLRDAHQPSWRFSFFPRMRGDAHSIKTTIRRGRGRAEPEWSSCGVFNPLFWKLQDYYSTNIVKSFVGWSRIILWEEKLLWMH